MPNKTEEGKASKKQQTLEDVDINVKYFGLGIYFDLCAFLNLELVLRLDWFCFVKADTDEMSKKQYL